MSTEPNNTNRAGWALEAINAFRRETGTDDCDALGDLLANLMHLCDAKSGQDGWDFDAMLERARSHYQEECAEERAAFAEEGETFLTTAVIERFLAYAKDAGNWGGEPLIGGNVGGDAADKGYIANMKKAGLVRTVQDSDNRECFWLIFTEAGKARAALNGILIG
jgi:hypothetical protein